MTNTLEKLAMTTGLALTQCGWLLATAESCTGGGLSYWLTSIAGSSDWFERGFVTYSNEAKHEMLGVQTQTLTNHGAVSAQTAHEMAAGALRHSHADVSIAITGIAGPTGGSAEKPVGTVWVAWAKRTGATQSEVNVFPGNRQAIRTRAMELALAKLLTFLRE